MSYVAPDKPPWDPPAQSSGGSPVKWIILGCGVFFLLGILVCGGVAIWGVRMGMQVLDQFSEEYVAKGYQKQMGQMIQVGQSPETKTVYVCQVLKVTAAVDQDIAAVCQVMEVHADIHGDLDFVGQVLVVKPGATIDGDLRVKNAQSVQIEGEVKGSISGNYMTLTYKGSTFSAGQSPKPAEAPANAPKSPAAPESPEAPKAAEAPATPEAPASPGESKSGAGC